MLFNTQLLINVSSWLSKKTTVPFDLCYLTLSFYRYGGLLKAAQRYSINPWGLDHF